jgi:hypothetical protein
VQGAVGKSETCPKEPVAAPGRPGKSTGCKCRMAQELRREVGKLCAQ